MDNAGSGMVRRVLPITTKNHRLKSDLLKGLRAETLDAAGISALADTIAGDPRLT